MASSQSGFLLRGPCASRKTAFLLDRFCEGLREDPARPIWLVPSPTAVAELLRALTARMGVLVAPPVFTLEDFALELVRAVEPETRWLAETHQRLVLRDVLEQLDQRKKIPRYSALLHRRPFTDALFDIVRDCAATSPPAPVPRPGTRPLRPHRRTETDPLLITLQAWRAALRETGCCDRAELPERARDLWLAGQRGPFASVRVLYVSGFHDFTPRQFALLEALASSMDQFWFEMIGDGVEGRDEVFRKPTSTCERIEQLRPGGVTVIRVQHGERFTPWPRPHGLQHLRRHLFRDPGVDATGESPAEPSVSAEASGLALIAAPGPMGEVRLAARSIKQRLLQGIPADRILVTARDLDAYADLVIEVFREYGIPLDIEASRALDRSPGVRTLLRAVQLGLDDFPFAELGDLLRSTLFQPPGETEENRPERAAEAEMVLRQLGVTRGKHDYLAEVARQAEIPPPRDPDDTAGQSRAQWLHEHAQHCLPFLRQFFGFWQDFPQKAGLGEWIAWLRQLARDLGLERTARHQDPAAWTRFWLELDGWQAAWPTAPRWSRSQFFHRLHTLTAQVKIRESSPGPGRVRVVPALDACAIDCDRLYLLGLGEGQFPDPRQGFGSQIDRASREALKRQGWALPSVEERLADERLLFLQLASRPREELVLTYAAVNESGQELLPGIFLQQVLELYSAGAIPTTRQKLRIADTTTLEPLSPAEYRVRWAAAGGMSDWPRGRQGLPAPLRAHLQQAQRMAQARTQSPNFSHFEGMLSPEIVGHKLREQFGSECRFSASTLEHYANCPFRFLLQDVLKLQPLTEPREDVEQTRRGIVVHRSLARMHRLRTSRLNDPAFDVVSELTQQLREVLDEDSQRAGTPVARMLWQLEGQRLQRAAQRYETQMQRYSTCYQGVPLRPEPRYFEHSFGLKRDQEPLRLVLDTVEVRLSGQIDRVDLAQLPDGTEVYWIIDYKTGSAARYSGTELTAMRSLQLTLYALAVEQLLLPQARPIGLVYWMFTQTGHKLALPAANKMQAWIQNADAWPEFRAQVIAWITQLVARIRQGEFPLSPVDPKCTEICPYDSVCRISSSRSVDKQWDLPQPKKQVAEEE